jgi:hypothetical protein
MTSRIGTIPSQRKILVRLGVFALASGSVGGEDPGV